MKNVLLAALAALLISTASVEALEPGQPRGCPSRWCGCYLAHYFGTAFTGFTLRHLNAGQHRSINGNL